MTLTTSAHQVSHTTPTLLVPEQSGVAGSTGTHKGITIQNLGPNPIWVGDSTVTPTSGVQVPADAVNRTCENSLVLRHDGAAVYAIADNADQTSPLDTRVALEHL